jgi:hypothetical protein
VFTAKHFVTALGLLVASSTSALAGIGLGTGTIHWTYYDAAYTPISDISIAGGSGQLLTQVLGDPFGVPQQQFDKSVTDAMYGAHFGPPTHFTTTATSSYYPRPFAVRMVFDSVYPMSINTICVAPPELPPARTGPGTGSVRLSAAFCQEGRVLTYLEAGGSGYRGPDDPRFVAFIKDVTYALFPPKNPTSPNFRDGHERFGPDHMKFRLRH